MPGVNGTEGDPIDLAIFLPFNCVECLFPGPDRILRSGAMNKFMKLLARFKGVPPFVLQVHKMLEQADIETNIFGPIFLSDPPEEISEHNILNAKALKLSYSTILN